MPTLKERYDAPGIWVLVLYGSDGRRARMAVCSVFRDERDGLLRATALVTHPPALTRWYGPLEIPSEVPFVIDGVEDFVFADPDDPPGYAGSYPSLGG